QHALGIAEIALVLLHAGARQRAAELRQERAAEKLRHRQVDDVRELLAVLFGALRAGSGGDTQDVEERATRVADGLEDLLQAAPAVVFDDDAGARTDVRLDPGFSDAWISGSDGDPGFVEPSRQGSVFDDEFDLEPGQQDLVEHPDDELVLADR